MKFKEISEDLQFLPWDFDIPQEDGTFKHVHKDSFPWFKDQFPFSVKNIKRFESVNPDYKFCYLGVSFSTPNELCSIKYEKEQEAIMNKNNFKDAKGKVIDYSDYIASRREQTK